MKQINDYDTANNVALLLTGEPGTRKTTSVLLAFPKVFIADCDNNLAGPFRFLKEHHPEVAKTIRYDTINDEPKPFLRHKRLLASVEEAFKSPDIGTVFVDSATTVSDYIIDRILQEQGHKTMQMADWGVYLGLWKHMVVASKTYGKNFVLSCHLKPEKDEVSGLVKYFLNIPGQFGNIAGSLFTDVWHASVEEKSGKHIGTIKVQPSLRHALKCSLNIPASFDFDPDIIKKALK